ncbi:MAG: pro-sigmaK processing inhibitor BofA family protein [Eubacteriales bacterium]|nr:pro-sigmaK processing inhibitor BofA family protein [Bacillota bacterium]MDP3051169.1 pro-sigmaK processing inhibitor BofA family protein [Eubacteriales bacterium]MDQ7789905.1 pro-sigmaK processing inhibitor BofA family protein [Clostridia bacterium]MDZ4042192.1 pro-sigmaK processing inhibitor BofA family protein [Eubacteriales bacterium]MDZ7609570.1 pro-sigmaK processing inhibitor BofA family protein [Eubacteriales bacterium]
MDKLDWKLVLLGLLGLGGLYLIANFLITPFRYLCRVVGYVLVGVALLVVVNLGGALVGFHIPFNAVTIITAGALQVPGVVLLVLTKVFII